VTATLVLPLVKDVHGILNNFAAPDQIVLSPNRDKLYVFKSDGVRQLNLTTGDLLYGTDGKDKITKISSNATQPMISYFNGKMYFIYTNGYADRSYRVGYMDENLATVNDIPTNLYAGQSVLFITQSSDDIYLWFNAEHERKPALQSIVIKKIIQ
jgi:hypothetical protein